MKTVKKLIFAITLLTAPLLFVSCQDEAFEFEQELNTTQPGGAKEEGRKDEV